MTEKTQGFWSSVPGILTGLAAVITACTGLYIAIASNSDVISVEVDYSEAPDSVKTSITPSNQAAVEIDNVLNQHTLPAKVKQNVTAEVKQPVIEKAPFRLSGSLVDCALFPTVNSVDSLMSWSNYYHKKIVAAKTNNSRALEPCNKTIEFRGMAHCKAPADAKVRSALLESLTLCRAAGIEWQNIKHTSIIESSKK